MPARLPGLFVMILILLGKAVTMSGWGEAMDFLFGMNWDKLTAAGVQVEHHCYEGMIHGFMNMSGVLPQARAAVSLAAATLRAALT